MPVPTGEGWAGSDTGGECKVNDARGWSLHLRRRPSADTTATKRRAGPIVLTVERVAVLRRVPLFARVPDHVLANVAHAVEEVVVGPDDVLITEGAMHDTLIVIVEGSLRVHHGDRTLVELGPGSSVGELWVLSPERRRAAVSASSDAVVLRLTRRALDELMTDHVEIGRAAIRMLVDMVRERSPQDSSACGVAAPKDRRSE